MNKMKTILKGIANGLKYLYEHPRFDAAVRKAKQASHMHNGRDYYVFKLQGKFRVYDIKDIKKLQKMKIFRKDIPTDELLSYACFTTKK
jgi:hypothetical protein